MPVLCLGHVWCSQAVSLLLQPFLFPTSSFWFYVSRDRRTSRSFWFFFLAKSDLAFLLFSVTRGLHLVVNRLYLLISFRSFGTAELASTFLLFNNVPDCWLGDFWRFSYLIVLFELFNLTIPLRCIDVFLDIILIPVKSYQVQHLGH